MKLLDAVNLILPALGEHPVTSLEVRHPTLSVILPQIDQQRREYLLAGKWFNTYYTTLPLGSDGTVSVPLNTLSFVPNDPRLQASIRTEEKLLFNGSNMSFIFTAPVKGTLYSDVDFDNLPESVAASVFYRSLVMCYITDIGMENEVNSWQAKATGADALVMQEHLRNKQYSARRSPRFINYVRSLRG